MVEPHMTSSFGVNPREAALQALAELLGQLEFNHFQVSLGVDEGTYHPQDLTK